MHIVNLLEHFLPELILFILKDLSNQDLKNFRSINDIWQSKANLEWSKRKTLFDFRTMSLVQGENTVKDFYLKLKECNKSFGYSKKFLKCALLKGLSSENKIKVLMDGLQALALDEILKRLEQIERCFAIFSFKDITYNMHYIWRNQASFIYQKY